jgi:hypothetical protein
MGFLRSTLYRGRRDCSVAAGTGQQCIHAMYTHRVVHRIAPSNDFAELCCLQLFSVAR